MNKLGTNSTPSPPTSKKASTKAKATKPGKAAPPAKPQKGKALQVEEPSVSADAPETIMAQQVAILEPAQPSSPGVMIVAPSSTDAPSHPAALVIEPPNPAMAQGWRLAFLAALTAENDPDHLKGILERGIADRVWAQLSDLDGKPFVTFEAFCEAPTPYGLGTPEAEVRRFLNVTLGERATKRLTAPASAQGQRNDLLGLQAIGGGKSNPQTRTQIRLAAINRAAPVVRKLHDDGVLGQVEAAALGPAENAPEKKKALVDQVVAKLERLVADRETMGAGDFKAKIAEAVAGATPPPVEILTSVHVGDPAEVLPKILKVHVPSNAGLVLNLTPQQATWAALPKTYVEMKANDNLTAGKQFSVILVDDPEENLSAALDKAEKLEAGGIIIVDAQPKQVDGVMQDVVGPAVFALHELGFDWVDQVIIARKPSACDRKAASKQKAAVIVHSTLMVFRKAEQETTNGTMAPTAQDEPPPGNVLFQEPDDGNNATEAAANDPAPLAGQDGEESNKDVPAASE